MVDGLSTPEVGPGPEGAPVSEALTLDLGRCALRSKAQGEGRGKGEGRREGERGGRGTEGEVGPLFEMGENIYIWILRFF